MPSSNIFITIDIAEKKKGHYNMHIAHDKTRYDRRDMITWTHTNLLMNKGLTVLEVSPSSIQSHTI